MTRVLFVVTSFRQGGISRSLQNLLAYMRQDEMLIDVYAMEDYGPYKDSLSNCNIVPAYRLLSNYIGRYDDVAGINKLAAIITKTLRRVLEKIKIPFNHYVLKWYANKIAHRTHYDTVVAFGEGVTTYFVSLFPINHKVCWIHCDYASYYELNCKKDELEIYNVYNTVINVSKFTRNSFNKIYPNYRNESTYIYNVLDDYFMKAKALEADFHKDFKTDKFTIVSIGRLDPVKNMSIIPTLASKLKHQTSNFRWYIIGPANVNSELEKINQGIDKYNLRDCVCYIGSQDNPYKYIKHSDILVNVSISEACPYVINEAKILHKPVVCTNFGSATEFIQNGENGFIADYDDMPNVIYGFMTDSLLRERINNALSNYAYDNNAIIKQIWEILR